MVDKKNFPKAYKEAYVILNKLSFSKKIKIPKSVFTFLKSNMDKKYKFNVITEKLKDTPTLYETKVIISKIYYDYLANDYQKSVLNEIQKLQKAQS